MKKSKIIINIHHYDASLLEEHRLSFLLNNRCFVVSEMVDYPVARHYTDGVVFSPYDQLVETCEYYLKPENEALRVKIAKTGYQLFSQYHMTDKIKSVLAQMS